jgi:hypothetical protein
VIIITDTPRRDNDFYPTPYGLCRDALSLLPETFTPEIVLDPGCGEGRWGLTCKKRYPSSQIAGFDLSKEHIKVSGNYFVFEFGDYVRPLPFLRKHFDAFPGLKELNINLVMGNPPYKYAEEFIRNSLTHLANNGYLLFLLRLDFLASEDRRKDLWKEFPPKSIHICSRRPSFNTPKDRKTDGNSYAIYLWQKGMKWDTTLNWLEWNYDKELDYEN